MEISEVLKLPLEDRLKLYGTKNITSFKLDAETYTGYKGYSFFWELTLASEPKRSSSGVIDLSSNAYFITPHLRIDFSLISYSDFMRLRQQMLSKLRFNLTCWDTDFNKEITEEVYFYPDTLPAFQMMARKLNGEKWVEILGAKDYTVELVGTNRLVEKKTIQYNLNKPSDVSWSYDTQVTKDFAQNTTVGVGNNAFIVTGQDGNGNDTSTKISTITFDEKYQFQYWCATADGSGFKYIDGDEYFLRQDTIVYAIWKASATQ
jgi:hypothetical protein